MYLYISLKVMHFISIFIAFKYKFYMIKQDILEVIYIYMLPIAGKTAEPNGLNFFVDTQGFNFFSYGQRRALQLVINIIIICIIIIIINIT